MFISKGFNGKGFKISNLPPKFKLTRIMVTTQKFYWFLLLYWHHVVHGKNDDETRKFPIRKRVKCLGEISSERERERERCINMRHAIWRNICWNLCLLFNRSSLLLCRNCTLRAEILPQWSIITRNTAWGKYSKTL